ncbi:MAG TPA: shikimate kinase [Pyrinomonadaceae bacterium]|nr:shikimate kinase [Pyrinomonadaceae bacterium]
MSTRRIVILGFMGCGKTTVANEVAHELNCRCVDLDTFITERERRSPAEIIPDQGEEAFRELETLALRDALQDKDTHVIALGGGTWITPANRTLIALYDCLTVWLDAPFELCWSRIMSANAIRPLAPDRETAQKRFDARRSDYRLAERQITVNDGVSATDIAKEILIQT